MPKIVVFTDPHLKDKPPLSRKDDYTETIFGKMVKCFKLAEKLEAEAIVIPGDLFDVRFASKVSHALVERTLALFKASKVPVFGITGNHDIINDRLESVPKQPIGVLYRSGFLMHLDKFTLTDGTTLYGVDFTNPKYTKIEDFFFKKAADELQIVFTHHNLVPTGNKFFDEGAISFEDLKDHPLDILVNGHIHHPIDGKYIVKIKDKTFVTPGSISRGSISKDNRNRKVYALLIDTQARKIDLVDLKATPSEDVFKIEQRLEELKRDAEIQTFAKMLDDMTTNADDEDLSAMLLEMDISTEVREKAEAYLQKSGEKFVQG